MPPFNLIPMMDTESSAEIEITNFYRPNPIIECSFCKIAIKQVETMIGDDRDEAKIRIALGKVCSHLPRVAKRKCKNYVHKFSNQIVELLVEKLPPKEVRCISFNGHHHSDYNYSPQVCHRLKLCASTAMDVEDIL